LREMLSCRFFLLTAYFSLAVELEFTRRLCGGPRPVHLLPIFLFAFYERMMKVLLIFTVRRGHGAIVAE